MHELEKLVLNKEWSTVEDLTNCLNQNNFDVLQENMFDIAIIDALESDNQVYELSIYREPKVKVINIRMI